MVSTPVKPTTETTSETQVKTVLTSAKFASGRTQPGATNWKKEGAEGIGVYIDTSAAGFTKTPIYVTSLGGYNGGSHWGTTGATSIYNASEKGFTVYVRFDKDASSTPITAEQANQKKWHINWIAIEPFLEESSINSNLTPSTTAQSSPLPTTGKYYKLANKNSGKYLDVAGGSTEDSANVLQWSNGTGANQQWLLEDAGDGSYYLTAKHSGKVLNVSGGGSNDGANVIQYKKGNDNNSKWLLEDAGDGYFYIIAKHSGKALDVASAGTADGANVQQYTKNQTNAQKWKFEPV